MNKIDIRKKINDSKLREVEMIKKIVLGGSSFLLLTPIYLVSMNEESIPTAIFTALEMGTLYIPLNAIKILREEKKNLKLYEEQLNNMKKSNLNEDNSSKVKQKTKTNNLSK